MLSVGENKQAAASTSPRGEQIPNGDMMCSCPRPASSRTEQGATGIAVVTEETDNPQKMRAQLAARDVQSNAILAGTHWLHSPVTMPALGISSAWVIGAGISCRAVAGGTAHSLPVLQQPGTAAGKEPLTVLREELSSSPQK